MSKRTSLYLAKGNERATGKEMQGRWWWSPEEALRALISWHSSLHSARLPWRDGNGGAVK